MCAQVYISLSMHYHGIKLGGSMMFLMAFRCRVFSVRAPGRLAYDSRNIGKVLYEVQWTRIGCPRKGWEGVVRTKDRKMKGRVSNGVKTASRHFAMI